MPTFNPPPTLNHIVQLHQHLVACDRAYAQQPTNDTHTNILRAQRAYYSALSIYHKHQATNQHANKWDILVKRAKNIMTRARMNAKREKHNSHWQQITAHQWTRANRIRMRAIAVHMAEVPAQPRKKRTPEEMREVREQQAKRTRIKHPVTGRYIYVDNP